MFRINRGGFSLKNALYCTIEQRKFIGMHWAIVKVNVCVSVKQGALFISAAKYSMCVLQR